jgi:HlyD family secretion protein
MRKWVILLVVVGLVMVGWYFARQQEFVPPWAMPKFGEVTRGDIRVPITAAGLIHAKQVIEIKPEASGEVVEVPVDEGTFVRKGDTLMILDPEDEQRSVDRAKANFDRAEALLSQAEVAVEQAKVNIENAKVRLAELEAQAAITQYEVEKLEAWEKEGRTDLYNPQQLNDARARQRMSLAQIDAARIAINSAKLTMSDREAAVKSQRATVESARKDLEEAEQRLRETTTLAPEDGIVTEVYVKPGNLVQSGTQSLTGGTVLMTLADVAEKKVIARLDEADYGRVLDISPVDALPEMPGLRQAAETGEQELEQRSGLVTITVDAFPELEFEGRIERVEPQGKLNAGSSIIQFDVQVVITDARQHLLPLGAQAQVEFTVESATDTLRVPAEAVKTFEDQRGIYVKTEPNQGETFGKRFVPSRFGISDGEFTQVVAVTGDFELTEGTQVYTQLPRMDENN